MGIDMQIHSPYQVQGYYDQACQSADYQVSLNTKVQSFIYSTQTTRSGLSSVRYKKNDGKQFLKLTLPPDAWTISAVIKTEKGVHNVSFLPSIFQITTNWIKCISASTWLISDCRQRQNEHDSSDNTNPIDRTY